MNETIIVALIGSVGVVIGATLSFLASFFSTRQKLKEIELMYYQKLDESHLSNARLHIETLYIPLNISLTKLADDFERMSGLINLDVVTSQNAVDDAKKEFQQACAEFVKQISELFNLGEDAYLIGKLDRHLRIFAKFIKESMNAPKLSSKFTHQVILNSDIKDMERKGMSRKELDHLIVYFSAPIVTVQFRQQFEYGIYKLKFLIKEVTLGTVPPK